MCTKTAHIKDFGINGCQVPVGNGICGETHSLDIIKQFRKLYEDKINSIDCAAGGDCLQEKLRIQQEWIGDLTEQNEMLVRAVQELENEATERVQMLEEKLQQSAKCVCEAEEMLKQQECKTRELQAKIEYYCSFGDVESMSRELKCKSDECESLKQSLIDTRQALTEEVAIKHDDILQLKRDVFNLEDRCIQADKQTAFRDDIIKELRKEIKQLKQQVTLDEVTNLTMKIDELNETLQSKQKQQEQIVKEYQAQINKLNDTVCQLTCELNKCTEKYDSDAKVCKICKGRSKIGFLHNSEIQVDLDNETLKKQQCCIQNKDEIIKIQKETVDAMEEELQLTRHQMCERNCEIDRKNNELHNLNNRIGKLEESLSASEERSNNLQLAQECTCYKQQIAKLSRQKKRNEEIISYFKTEMTVMAEQLCKLQEMLTCSNESVQEEYTKILGKFNEVQSSNDKLSTQLCAAEQQCQLECQMNQLHENKIHKLQQMVKQKEDELTRHQDAVHDIRNQLQRSLDANIDLRSMVEHLNETICGLKCEVERHEVENCRAVESTQQCRSQISTCFQRLTDIKEALNQKSNELSKLEMDYNNQHRLLTATQKKLQEFKEKEQDKQCMLKCTLEDLREKLDLTEANHTKLCEDYTKLQEQLAIVSRREAVKDLEVKRYRKIVGDLKKTLVDLNQTLSNKEFQNKCKNKECRKNMDVGEASKLQDICLNCPCEVEFYQSMVDNLKKAVIELKQKLADIQKANGELEKEKSDLISSLNLKENEYEQLKQKLTEKLQRDRQNETKHMELATQLQKELDNVKQELQVKMLQLTDVKRSAQEINGSKCVQLACAQEEITNLKAELQRLTQRQCELNCENDRLQAHSDRLRATVKSLEDKGQMLRGQMENYLEEVHNLRVEKESLMRKNRELLGELRSLQSSYGNIAKQNREPQCQTSSKPQKRPCKILTTTPYRGGCVPTCQSPWSLGSQGVASGNDESPTPSPCPNEDSEWYSPTFRVDTDDEESEDDWVDKLETLTCQVRKTNKLWANEKKMRDANFDVCRDRCKKQM